MRFSTFVQQQFNKYVPMIPLKSITFAEEKHRLSNLEQALLHSARIFFAEEKLNSKF